MSVTDIDESCSSNLEAPFRFGTRRSARSASTQDNRLSASTIRPGPGDSDWRHRIPKPERSHMGAGHGEVWQVAGVAMTWNRWVNFKFDKRGNVIWFQLSGTIMICLAHSKKTTTKKQQKTIGLKRNIFKMLWFLIQPQPTWVMSVYSKRWSTFVAGKLFSGGTSFMTGQRDIINENIFLQC